WTAGLSEPIGGAHFVETSGNPRSRFPLPVGTESYTVGRQYLRNDALPEPASVRVEDYLNFFDYEDLSPRKEDFAITMEGGSSYAPRGPDYRYLRIGVRAVAPGEEERSTPNLTRFLQAIAYDTETEVEFNPKVVSRYRLVGYENRAGYGRYRDDSVEGGGVRAGHRTTALYEVKLVSDAEPQTLATVRLSYRPAKERERREITSSISSGQIEESWEKASPSLQLAVAVATYAEVLKKTHWNRNFDLFDLAARLDEIAARWPDDERVQELAQLARKAASLSRLPEGR
ncbi:MAG: von Willebrand factor type A domain-containing protein, partial [Acidobacteria bacterium]|nr:von Willebrand factor type A domain-containing protein [Acidobacteriota bacterium]